MLLKREAGGVNFVVKGLYSRFGGEVVEPLVGAVILTLFGFDLPSIQVPEVWDLLP